MKTLIRTVLALFWLNALAASAAAQDCPQGLQPLDCAGGMQCQPRGSKCCGTIACSPLQICLRCQGVDMCRAPGTECCGNDVCGPDQTCMYCGTQKSCLPSGQQCPRPGD
jgi:hypothetical protein